MQLTTTETKIMELFVNNIFLELSINTIAKRLGKHYRVIRVNVLSLLKKNLLKSTDLAGAKVISLNLKDVTLPMYMPHIEEVSSYNKVFRVLPQIGDIIKKAEEISSFFCLGVFGSHANNTQKKGSDIDFFLICPSSHIKKYRLLINEFPAIEELIDWNVFSEEEFKKGLKTRGVLVYKEIAKNKRIIKGAGLFYSLIAEVGSIEQD